MPHEFVVGNGVEQSMQPTQEAVAEREPFFEGVELKGNRLICSDDRTEDGIHVFGGVAHIAYNRTVMMEASEPGSTAHTTFGIEIRASVRQLEGIGVSSTIHSDEKNEAGLHFHADKLEDGLGCAYIGKRQTISKLIAEEGEDIISTVASQNPDLFTSPEDYAWAKDVVGANGRIADNDAFFREGPRAVAAAAVEEGAEAVVFEGEHDPSAIGIINNQPNTTLSSKKARAAGKPAYDVDQWAVDEVNDLSRNIYPYDKKKQKIAEAIDNEGVFRALSVQTIGVR